MASSRLVEGTVRPLSERNASAWQWGFAAIVVSDIIFVAIVVVFIMVNGFSVLWNFGPAIWGISAIVTTTLLFVLIGIAGVPRIAGVHRERRALTGPRSVYLD